jgi:hypothetical protein
MELGIRDIYDEDDRRPDSSTPNEEDEELEQAVMKRRPRKYGAKKRMTADPRPANVAAESDY